MQTLLNLIWTALLSDCHDPVLYQNGLICRRNSLTTW